jgi:predicted TIM-barrel fold metal-dependent hydrolase
MLPLMPRTLGLSTEQLVEDAKKFYFDTAISSNPVTLKALFEFAAPGHVLFGSDFPNAPGDAILRFTKSLEEYEMSDETKVQVNSRAALELFPRLKENLDQAKL